MKMTNKNKYYKMWEKLSIAWANRQDAEKNKKTIDTVINNTKKIVDTTKKSIDAETLETKTNQVLQLVERMDVIAANRYCSEDCYNVYDYVISLMRQVDNPRQRLALYYHYCNYRTDEQLQHILKYKSIRSVENILYRARKELKEIIKKDIIEGETY